MLSWKQEAAVHLGGRARGTSNLTMLGTLSGPGITAAAWQRKVGCAGRADALMMRYLAPAAAPLSASLLFRSICKYYTFRIFYFKFHFSRFIFFQISFFFRIFSLSFLVKLAWTLRGCRQHNLLKIIAIVNL
jgi:hypothetical protein